MSSGFEVIKNAKVKVSVHWSSSFHANEVKITVDEKYQHVFAPGSRVSSLSHEVEKKVLENRFNGGSFVFQDGKLIDFRFSDYQGYTRSLSDIEMLGEVIGFSKSSFNDRAVKGDLSSYFNRFRHKHGVFLGGAGEDFNLDIGELGEGGSFLNRLVYRWSPFTKNIHTSIEVERLICNNGMIGMAPLVTRETPVINDVENHLSIIEMNLRPTMNSILENRFCKMSNARASISDVVDANNLIKDRIRTNKLDEHDYKVLMGLDNLTRLDHLSGIYSPELFSSQAAKTAGSDITQFDLFNILTEMTTHTKGSQSEDSKIQKFINKLVFDSQMSEISSNVKISEDSDHKRVFFGQNS